MNKKELRKLIEEKIKEFASTEDGDSKETDQSLELHFKVSFDEDSILEVQKDFIDVRNISWKVLTTAIAAMLAQTVKAMSKQMEKSSKGKISKEEAYKQYIKRIVWLLLPDLN